MVEEPLRRPPLADPARALAVGYAPAAARAGVAALLALDDRLGAIARGGRDPMVRTLRLTWWFEALEALDAAPPPAEPVLRALAAEVLPRGVAGVYLAGMVDGWELMVGGGPLGDAELADFGKARGSALFAAMAELCGSADGQAREAGAGWALADLARTAPDAATRERAKAMAAERLRQATARRWSRAGRALGALALIARAEMEARAGAGLVGRLLLHRLTGR